MDGLLSSHASPCVREPEREPPTQVPSWSESQSLSVMCPQSPAQARATAAQARPSAAPSEDSAVAASARPGADAASPGGGSSAETAGKAPAKGESASHARSLSVDHQQASAEHSAPASAKCAARPRTALGRNASLNDFVLA